MDEQAQTAPTSADPTVEKPVVPKETAALVKRWLGRVKAAEKHWEPVYKRMREDMQMARAGADRTWIDADRYVVPLVQRHINQTVATIYAKNPKAVVQLKRRLEGTVWDGKPDSLAQAMQAQVMSAGLDPMANAVVEDAQRVQMQRQLLMKIGKSLEILFDHYLGEQQPPFKGQFKQTVRRAKTCGVAFVELGFQRKLQPDPDVSAQLADTTSKIAALEALAAKGAEGKIEDDSADLAELTASMEDLKTREYILVREGPVYGFPRSTELVVDPACRDLKGFVGAGWVARKYLMMPDQVRETYQVDIRSGYTPYHRKGGELVQESSDRTKGEPDDCGKAVVYFVQDRKTEMEFVVCEGYEDFLRPPAAPEIRIERFWRWFTLAFNSVEDEDEIYPISDARILRHPQMEYNRTREELRQHRIANRPVYAAKKGMLSDDDKKRLSIRESHEVVELDGMIDANSDVEKVISAIKPAPIDSALYDTDPMMSDILVGIGQQEANLGGSSGATATEASIAEQSRMPVIASDVDELDEFLSELARATGQLMLRELSKETVVKIVGPGAVWPELDAEAIADEVYLDIKAGSSGRPNKAAELANTERAMPYLVQMDGILSKPLADKYAALLDIDIDELYQEGLPSIVARNAMMSKPSPQPGTGDPQDDPGAQGDKGGANQPAAAANEPGAQPQYPPPAPAPGMMG